MLKIGITGGIGSGKSLVSRLFAQLGVPVFDADTAAREIMHADPQVRAALEQTFGAGIYQKDGQLDRQRLAGLVFKDKAALAALNAITHPATIRRAAEWMKMQEEGAHAPRYVLKEAALLFEANSATGLDGVIGVYTSKERRIQRVMDRDHMTREVVLGRMDKQMEETVKMQRCDWIMVNEEDRLLWPEVLRLHQYLQDRATPAKLLQNRQATDQADGQMPG